MITVDDWYAAGYKRWETREEQIHKLANFGLQKRFDDSVGKKYFITVYVYDNKRFKEYNQTLDDFGFMPVVQFCEGIYPTVEIKIFEEEDQTIEKIETLVEHLWLALNKPYEEKWDEP